MRASCVGETQIAMSSSSQDPKWIPYNLMLMLAVFTHAGDVLTDSDLESWLNEMTGEYRMGVGSTTTIGGIRTRHVH